MSSVLHEPPTQPVHEPSPPAPQGSASPSWSAGQIVALVLGLAALFGSAASFVAAAGLDALEDRWRDNGYLTSDRVGLQTDGFALSVEDIDLDGYDGFDADWLLGRARVRVTSLSTDTPVFVGIATEADAAAYLRGVRHSSVVDFNGTTPQYLPRSGGAPTDRPADQPIWASQATGIGGATLTWTPEEGDWAVVIMNADGSGPVDVTADVGVGARWVDDVERGLQITGAVAAVSGAVLVGAVVLRRRRRTDLRAWC